MLAVRQGLSSLHIHSLNKSLCASYLAPRSLASLVAQLVKNPPATWETWVPPLGWEDPLEKGITTDSSILAWRIPWTDCIVRGTQLSDFHFQIKK